MATQVQNRRGTTAEHSTFTGAVGEVTVDTDKDTVVVHDGSTAGGHPLLRQDQDNLPTSAPTNGLYLPSANNVAISVDSSERIRIGESGEIGLSGTNYGTSGQVLTSAGSGAAPTWSTVGGSSILRSTVAIITNDGSPATMNVTNDGTSSYQIDGVANPDLTLFRGRTYTFQVNALGHPFRIKTARSTGQGDMYTSGITNNGEDVGTIQFIVPEGAPNTLYYQCEFHSSMGGTINIADDGDATGVVNLPRSGMLLSVQSTKAGWFRLYNRADNATADATRTRTEDPDPGSGVLIETISTGTETIRLTPSPMIANMESPVTDEYSYRFKNDGTAGSATITLNYLILEA